MKMALPLHVPRFVDILNAGGKLEGAGSKGEIREVSNADKGRVLQMQIAEGLEREM